MAKMMLLPIRCFTCGKVIGRYAKAWDDHKNAGLEPASFFEKHGLSRFCCRKILLTTVDVTQWEPPFSSDNIVLKKDSEVVKILPAV
jgi:DNA-directed RNA polymerase subunit N